MESIAWGCNLLPAKQLIFIFLNNLYYDLVFLPLLLQPHLTSGFKVHPATKPQPQSTGRSFHLSLHYIYKNIPKKFSLLRLVLDQSTWTLDHYTNSCADLLLILRFAGLLASGDFFVSIFPFSLPIFAIHLFYTPLFYFTRAYLGAPHSFLLYWVSSASKYLHYFCAPCVIKKDRRISELMQG